MYIEDIKKIAVEGWSGKDACWVIYQAPAGNFCVANDVEEGTWCGFNTLLEARQFIFTEDEINMPMDLQD